MGTRYGGPIGDVSHFQIFSEALSPEHLESVSSAAATRLYYVGRYVCHARLRSTASPGEVWGGPSPQKNGKVAVPGGPSGPPGPPCIFSSRELK